MQVTVRFGSVLPNLEGERSGGGQRPPTSLPFPPTTREDLRLDGYLETPPAAKALYIYKHPCLLRDSNPVPTALQSASLTTIPVGRHLEHTSLRHCVNPVEGLHGVHFHTELLSSINKNSDVPEYLRQLALEVKNGIPSDAILIYTDGSKDESNRSRSGAFIENLSTPGSLDATQKTAQRRKSGRPLPTTARCLGGALEFDGNRKDQTAVSRLLSGHLKGMAFESGRKVFQTCSKCHLLPASPEHILDCLGLALEDVHESPLLVLDFARVNGLMDLI
ncbi:uncharacterized protein TNCV_168811 [Trichonephila clavipes]|nr:uncharacterized protein TNCV_168811 [Trichonephila clavipes]